MQPDTNGITPQSETPRNLSHADTAGSTSAEAAISANAPAKNRIVFLDWLRVAACFMVMCVHSTEPFYLGGEGTQVLNHTNAVWSTLFDSAFRACIGLFVITSSYLLFPLQKPVGAFFKRRFQRVVVPFIVWAVILGVIYGIKDANLGDEFKPFVFNFNQYWGHFWFVYMILGLYLIMPLLSPWAERVSKRQERAFLLVWLFTTLFPFFRQAALAFSGSSELWGEANWNEFGLFYYVSGFAGYMILGHYFKVHVPQMSWKRTLAIAVPMWAVGYAIVAGWFWAVMPHSYPVNAPIDLAVHMEQSWRFCSIGVVLTTIAYFMIFRKITSSGWFYRNVILELSKASYGTYLMHLAFIGIYCNLFHPLMPTGACILLTAVCTFVTSSVISIACSHIPVIGQYISGYKH